MIATDMVAFFINDINEYGPLVLTNSNCSHSIRGGSIIEYNKITNAITRHCVPILIKRTKIKIHTLLEATNLQIFSSTEVLKQNNI